jgi:tRNA pseudouridine55 synthase
VLLVDKPAGVTSHDVVNAARRALHTRRIGHAGTLDPFATGLLVLLVGQATRLLPYVNGEPKVYDARIVFGSETSTDDATGSVTRTAALPDAARVRDGIAALTGPIDQVPPDYSAKQVRGRRAYAAARGGDPLQLSAVRVLVHRWDVRELASDHLDATITCGAGTYIRALARDLGRLTGSAAHLAGLRRTRSGPLEVAQAISLEALRAGSATLQPPVTVIPHLATIGLSAEEVVRVRHGQPLAAHRDDAATAALVGPDGALVAIAEHEDAEWRPRVVLGNG